MRVRTAIVLVFAALVAAFAAVNWSAFLTPTTLSLGVAHVDAPLGLVMLGLVVLVTLGFLAYVVTLRGTALIDARRHAKEMQAQRALAEQAEASRLAELRTAMHAEIDRLEGRIAQAESAFRVELRENVNSLAAMIGQLQDHLDRGGKPV
ncbi:MAG TPA: LapA family protein [Burkholderiaceae bacterium]|jgi:uncharacterized integral membrane protein|nr:LapA family protein [Burkholderiaceae bacterium]